MKVKEIAGRAALTLVSIALSTLVVEVGMRIYQRIPGDDHLNSFMKHHSEFCRYDPLYGWWHKPGINRIYAFGGFKIPLRFNSKGMRGPECAYEKKDKTYRILVLGDSFTEGDTVAFDEVFTTRLGRKLTTINRFCEVINAGCAGFSTDQELLFFEKEGKKYRPDLTVLMFNDNDVWQNRQPKDGFRGFKPYFIIQNGRLNLKNNPVPKPLGESESVHTATRKSLRSYLTEWLQAHSRLYHFVVSKVKGTPWLRKFLIKIGLMSYGHLDDFNNVYRKTPGPEVVDAWKITEAILRSLQKEVEAVGGMLLVFYVPDSRLIYAQKWARTLDDYGLAGSDWDVNLVAENLEAICNRNAMDFINPIAVFRKESARSGKNIDSLYDEIDFFWNSNGHKLASEILADYIDSKYLRNT